MTLVLPAILMVLIKTLAKKASGTILELYRKNNTRGEGGMGQNERECDNSE